MWKSTGSIVACPLQQWLCESATMLRYSLTYLLTAWSRVLLEKLTGFAANQEIPRILWNNPKVHYRTHKWDITSKILVVHFLEIGVLQTLFPLQFVGMFMICLSTFSKNLSHPA